MAEPADLPPCAAWQHHDVRDGFEVVFLRRQTSGYDAEGCTSAVEDRAAWMVRYFIRLDRNWTTRSAHVIGRSVEGQRQVTLEANGRGAWLLDGAPAPHLDGCLDVDLESSAFTNALPIHRLRLRVGQAADAPAAYVRAEDLTVERLGQHYRRGADHRRRQRYDYSAPRFDFRCQLVYDEHGLVLDYPGLAVRVR